LAATVSTLSADGRTFKPSIWRLATVPAGAGGTRLAYRLTRSAEGEDNPTFLPDGSLLFLSARPALPHGQPGGAGSPAAGQPGTGQPTTDQPGAARAGGTARKRAFWLLPADGREACQLTAPPGGISRLAAAARPADRDRDHGQRRGGAPGLAGAARGGRSVTRPTRRTCTRRRSPPRC
jgi:hypothetical protein